jgi:hypothetical protein
MDGLSTKLQENLALNANWSFLKLVSNAIIMDDTIHAHQESKKKKKALTAPSVSAPTKYRMVCAPCHKPQQQHQHLVTCPPPHQNIIPRAMTSPPTMSHPLP